MDTSSPRLAPSDPSDAPHPDHSKTVHEIPYPNDFFEHASGHHDMTPNTYMPTSLISSANPASAPPGQLLHAPATAPRLHPLGVKFVAGGNGEGEKGSAGPVGAELGMRPGSAAPGLGGGGGGNLKHSQSVTTFESGEKDGEGDKKSLNYLFHRKSRAKLANRFMELKDLLPNLPKTKSVNKSVILERAIDYIKETKLREMRAEADRIFATKETMLKWLEGVCCEHASIDDALSQIIPLVCIKYRWKSAELWIPMADGSLSHVLGLVDSFLDEDTLMSLEDFHKKSDQVSLTKTVGLPGRVMSSGQPEWFVGFQEPGLYVRHAEARKAGIRTGFAAPIVFGNTIYGVLILYDTLERALEYQTVESVSITASYLGSFYNVASMHGNQSAGQQGNSSY